MTYSRTIYPQTAMLNEVMELLMQDQKIESEEQAFEALVQLIAYELSYEVMIETPWLNMRVMESVREKLDLDLLREDKWDWLGEVYELRIGPKDYLVNRQTVEAYASKHIPKQETITPPTIMDTSVGTGRLILAIANRVNDEFPVIYYGAEPNLLAYRVAVLNCHLHNVNYKIVCLNSDAYDVRPHSPNWKYANQWKPVADKKLFTKDEVNHMNVKPMQNYPAVYYAR